MDGPKKNKNTNHENRRRTNRIRLLRAAGWRCSRSRFPSRDIARSSGGAAVLGLGGRPGQVTGRAVDEGHGLNRAPGHLDRDDAARGGDSFAEPQRGWLNAVGLLRGAVVWAQSTTGVTRGARGERLVMPYCRLSGFTLAGVAARRSAGCSSVGSLSGIRVRESLTRPARPTRKWSRRARRSCAILSPRRAAHLPR